MNGNKFRYYKCAYTIHLVREGWRIKAVWSLILYDLCFHGETDGWRFGKHAIAAAYEEMDKEIESVEGRWSAKEERKLGVDVIRDNVKKKRNVFDSRQIEISL